MGFRGFNMDLIYPPVNCIVTMVIGVMDAITLIANTITIIEVLIIMITILMVITILSKGYSN
jgi:hypothetical protein